MSIPTRREAIKGIALGSAGIAVANYAGSTAIASTSAEENAMPVQASRAFRGEHQPKPFPFDPTKLKGLSEKLIRSHHENNYTGAVKALNFVEQRLDAM